MSRIKHGSGSTGGLVGCGGVIDCFSGVICTGGGSGGMIGNGGGDGGMISGVIDGSEGGGDSSGITCTDGSGRIGTVGALVSGVDGVIGIVGSVAKVPLKSLYITCTTTTADG